jgi:hypothetical protein
MGSPSRLSDLKKIKKKDFACIEVPQQFFATRGCLNHYNIQGLSFLWLSMQVAEAIVMNLGNIFLQISLVSSTTQIGLLNKI